jgi:hypothetical protein
MQVNWLRGFTRLYCVAWALWLLRVMLQVALSALPVFAPANIMLIATLGLLIPGLLLLAMRWALAGFRAE